VTLRDVGFGYSPEMLISGVNLKIKPGARIAVIGANGSGKTTIANLILGLYKPQSGVLYAGEVPYEEADLIAMRRNIGVVSQHPLLFSGTVFENVAYGNGTLNMEQVIGNCRKAGAHEFIMKLKGSYYAQIGEDGTLLSGGECQRIAIARAIAGDPKLLILDEPTNHLDADAVSEIIGNIIQGAQFPSILIISHDMEVVRNANEIFRLEEGMLLRIGDLS
jgi:ABC-type bacteriocin/lantibiotic exporter with double-glycine peptidase domain